MNQEYILNPEVYFFENKPDWGLYNSETQKVIFVNEKIGIYLKQNKTFRKIEFPFKPKLFYKLIDLEFLIIPNTISLKTKNILSKISKPSIDFLYLLTTNKCNFNCKYCFINGNLETKKTENMSLEILTKSLDLFSKSRTKTKKSEILFYGGEPLLNFNIIQQATNIVRNKINTNELKNIKFNIITNGSLVSKSIAKFLYENNFGIGVSIDGPQKIHDKMRIYSNGKGTYKTVLKGYNNLFSQGNKVGISCTISNHNYLNLKQVLEHFTSELNCKNVGFNLLLDSFRFKNEQDLNIIVENILDAYDFGKTQGIFEDSTSKIGNPFYKEYIRYINCGACGKQIVVLPNGKIGPCQACLEDSRIFNKTVFNEKDINQNKVFLEWANRSSYTINTCKNCIAKSVCGGGCAYRAQIQTGNINSPDYNYCIFAKKTLNKLIWDAYEKIKDK